MLLRDPARYGWRYDGAIAAPCSADPYLRVSCVAQLLLDRHGMLGEPRERSHVLEQLYRDSYAHTRWVPRADASAVLAALVDLDLAIAVVTNSPPQVVARKLAALEVAGLERVQLLGDARKFLVDPRPRDPIYDALEDLVLPGLDAARCWFAGASTTTACAPSGARRAPGPARRWWWGTSSSSIWRCAVPRRPRAPGAPPRDPRLRGGLRRFAPSRRGERGARRRAAAARSLRRGGQPPWRLAPSSAMAPPSSRAWPFS